MRNSTMRAHNVGYTHEPSKLKDCREGVNRGDVDNGEPENVRDNTELRIGWIVRENYICKLMRDAVNRIDLAELH